MVLEEIYEQDFLPCSAWCRDQGYGRTDPNPAWGQATRT